MDKLKKVFSPGSSKDDEILYGDAEAKSASASKQPEREPETLHATEGSQKKEHSILRQIVNPGGDKYDDQRFGTTATTEAPDPSKLQTDPDQTDHTIMRQLVNPSGDKHDEQAYGTTAATAGDRESSVPTTETAGIDPNEKLETDKGQKEHGILRQILNPHGKKYDEEGYGKTAHAAEDDSSKPLPLMRPDQNLVEDKQAASSSRTEPSQSQASQSNLGRDATIAGGAAAVAGGGAYAATRDENEPERSNTTSGGTSSMQDKVGRDVGYDQSVQSTSATAPAESQTASQPAAYTALTREDPSSSQSGDNSHLGRDAAIAGGVGAIGAGGAYAATRDRDHKTEPSSEAALESEKNTGRDSAIAGTDPSTVGSGFLGSDTHGQHSSNTTGASSTLDAKPQTEGLADGRSAETAANEQSGQHNYGRDATLASGVAAGGALAAHETSKDRDQQGAKGDSFIAATGTAPISRPLDGDNDLTTGRTTESTGTSNLPNEFSKLESGAGTSINPIGAPESEHANGGHLGSGGTTAGSGFAEQGGSAGGLQSSSAPGDGHINPVGAPEAALTGSHHHGVIGSGVHNDTGSEQLNQAPADVQAATYTYSSQQLVGSSKPFEPHIPGEFPTETGEDPHEVSGAYGSTAGRTGDLPGTTSDRKDHTAATSGTAAGLATGAVVGGGLAAGDSSSKNIEPQQSSTIPTETSISSTQDYPLRSKTNQMDTPITPAVEPEQPKTDGRDAAIAGGAVGAGAVAASAASEATKKNDDAVPSTVGQTPDAALASKTADTPLAQPTTTPSAPVVPITEPPSQTPLQKDDPKLGKDAAVAEGAAAVGAAAVDAKDTGPAPKTIGPHDSDVKNVLDPRVQPDPAVQGSKKDEPAAAAAAPKATEDKLQGTSDAALAAGAAGGAAAAAGTSHDAYGQEDPNKHNKLHKPTPEEKKHDKELEKEQKKHDKAAEKEHKKAEKAAEKEHQKAEKQAEKDHKKAEKQAEKEYKKSEKEAEKAKKASFIDKILHRNEDKETEYVQNDKTGEKKGDLNHPLAGAAEAEQAERQAQGLPAKDAAAQPSAGLDGTSEGVVIEPHTGLPMNVGMYGAGSGGTDGAQQIEGYHEEGHAGAGQEGVAGPDWDAIKKANTPY